MAELEQMKSKICYSFITEYLKTKNLKVKRNPADNGAGDADMQAKLKEYSEDFKSKCEQISKTKIAEIEAKYNGMLAALSAKKDIWIQQARLDRFNSDDVNQYGEGGIKITMSQALNLANTPLEKTQEKNEKAADEKAENDLNKNINDNINISKQSAKSKQQEYDQKSKEQLEKINKNIKDIEEAARQIANKYDKNIDEFEADQLKKYMNAESAARKGAQSIGEPRGAEDVIKYNEALLKAAQKIVKDQQKAKTKAEIVKKSLVQKAKLKLGALLGL